MPQLKLETNLPVIFLTLLVIAIVVLGSNLNLKDPF